MEKSADAFRTISEVADDLVLPQHVLRFWEKNFPQIRPLKRAGGRRYYRPADVVLLRSIRQLLHDEGYTIRGVQRLLKEQGARGLRVGEPVMLALVEDLHENTIDADPMVERLADDATGPLRLVSDDKPVAGTPPAPEAGVVGTPGVLADTAALREALACIEACERILSALRLPRDENSLQGRSASPITPEVGV